MTDSFIKVGWNDLMIQVETQLKAIEGAIKKRWQRIIKEEQARDRATRRWLWWKKPRGVEEIKRGFRGHFANPDFMYCIERARLCSLLSMVKTSNGTVYLSNSDHKLVYQEDFR